MDAATDAEIARILVRWPARVFHTVICPCDLQRIQIVPCTYHGDKAMKMDAYDIYDGIQ